MKPKIQVVDENDNVIGAKTREEVDRDADIYRVSALWVTNSQGEILIAQRKFTKAHDPGRWGPAVAGTVEEGETYESNIYKEAEEEIGLTGYKFTLGPKIFVSHVHKFFDQWFFCVVDKPANEFKIQENELEAVAWITPEKLKEEMRNNPEKYIKSMPSTLELLLNKS